MENCFDFYEMMQIFPFDDTTKWDFSSQYSTPPGNSQPFFSNVELVQLWNLTVQFRYKNFSLLLALNLNAAM